MKKSFRVVGICLFLLTGSAYAYYRQAAVKDQSSDGNRSVNHTLTYLAGSGGQIIGNGVQTVADGADGTPVSAVADSGYRFEAWSDGVAESERADKNVKADISAIAYFTNQFGEEHVSSSSDSSSTEMVERQTADITPVSEDASSVTTPSTSSGGGSTDGTTETASLIQLTISDPLLTRSKPYDGNTVAMVVPGSLIGVSTGDSVSVTAIANYESAAVGTGKKITVVYNLGGLSASKYLKPVDYVVFNGTISPLTVSAPYFSPGAKRIPRIFNLVGSSDEVGTNIAIATATDGATIYYTSDGTDPTAASSAYSTGLLINADTILKAFAARSQYTSSAISSSSYTINQSAVGAFSWAHGTVSVGNKLYVTTRTNPATVTVFNNADDLSDHQTVTLTGHQNADVLIYDQVHDKIYASTYDAAAYAAPHNTTILQIDPNDISNWSVVYNSSTPYSDYSSPIVTDGEYVYGATASYYQVSKFFKIRISDWALVGTPTNWTGSYMAHAAQLVSYSDRKEMYVTNASWSNPARFGKINLNTMAFSTINLNTSLLTDDFACQKTDDNGATCYLGSDNGADRQKGFTVNTSAMSSAEFNSISACYGTFIYGGDLYFLGSNGQIAKYPALDLGSPVTIATPFIPNELLHPSNGGLYLTDWNVSSRMLEFSFP